MKVIRYFTIFTMLIVAFNCLLWQDKALSSESLDDAAITSEKYYAAGLYLYDIGSATLNMFFVFSMFPHDCGPNKGFYSFNNVKIDTMSMVWDEGGDDQLIWEKLKGEPDQLVGKWLEINDEFIANFKKNGIVSVVSSDGLLCD